MGDGRNEVNANTWPRTQPGHQPWLCEDQYWVFLGLRLGRRNSGESEPQLHISKEGDRYLRTLMMQGAHYILGPFGQDSDLRRWGLKLAEHRGKSAKKRGGCRGAQVVGVAAQVVDERSTERTFAH
jgi:hypothetical protein